MAIDMNNRKIAVLVGSLSINQQKGNAASDPKVPGATGA